MNYDLIFAGKRLIDQKMRTLLGAFRERYKKEPEGCQIWVIAAQARQESSFGDGWKPPCENSHNWGAIQAPGKKVNGKFESSVPFCIYPDSDHTGKGYTWGYRVYPSDIEGAADFLAKRDSLFLWRIDDNTPSGLSYAERTDKLRYAEITGDEELLAEGFVPSYAASLGNSMAARREYWRKSFESHYAQMGKYYPGLVPTPDVVSNDTASGASALLMIAGLGAAALGAAVWSKNV